MQRTFCLLDPRLVERTENLRLVLGCVRKDARNPLLIEDQPWEVRFDNLYPNVHWSREKGLFECWYNPFIVCEATSNTPDEEKRRIPYRPGKREMGVCYAQSRDGIVWEKPALGLIEFEGSTANNLVMRDIHGVGVYYDRFESDPARRYKSLTSVGTGTSPDGLRWTLRERPDIGAIGDTHNNLFWDKRTRRYVGFTRLWKDRQRIVARTESPDFVSWTRAEEVLRASEDSPHRQVYELIVFPCSSGYLGIAAVLDTESDCVDCELAWSPDTIVWSRVAEGSPLIPRGEEGSWDHGCIYAAAYPIITEKEVLLYYAGGNDTHMSWRKTGLGLARLRPDGFAGWRPVGTPDRGELVTTSIACSAPNLTVSADAEGGSIRAEVVGVEGFSLESCRRVSADVTGCVVTWGEGRTLAPFVGKTITLRFELLKATLYSIGFSG